MWRVEKKWMGVGISTLWAGCRDQAGATQKGAKVITRPF